MSGVAIRSAAGRNWRLAPIGLAGLMLAACATTHGPGSTAGGRAPGTMRPYEVGGVWYTPKDDPHYNKEGLASWYGQQFHHHMTADGEAFDMDVPSAAHKTLPLPCIVEVTNLENGRRIRVRVNDRGPFVGGRIIDLSRQGAKELGFYDKGVARVRVRYVGPAPARGGGDAVEYAEARVTKPRAAAAVSAALPLATGNLLLNGARTRVQIGAYADRGRAERAAAMAGGHGPTSIEATTRGGATLYRVFVTCAADRAQAVRTDLAASGFSGAKVVGPS